MKLHRHIRILTIILISFMSIESFSQLSFSEDFESGTATGWTNSGTATTGAFIVAAPTQQISTIVTQPDGDHTVAPGINAYFTATNINAGQDDVDGGESITTSPTYNISVLSDLSIWYFHGQRDTGGDAGDFFILEYSLDGGTIYNNLVSIGDVTTVATWTEATVNNIPSGSNLVLRVRVSDGLATGDIIEAGIDDLLITPITPTISIDDITVNENAGTATFTVTHSVLDASGPFTIDYTTSDNDAFAGSDYVSDSGTLSFSGTSGDTETVTISITDDTTLEIDETFFVNLSNPSDPSVFIIDSQGTGTITDNEISYVITNGTVNTCSGTFVDSGGISGNYNDFESFTYTICPDIAGSSVILDFTEFSTETGFDGLSIYQGTTASAATLIDTYDDSNIPGTIISSDASGCLTFIFTSDGSVNQAGWTADISCGSNFLTVNDVTVNESAGTATFTATLSGNVPGGFTVDYTTEDDTAFADSDYTTTSGSWSFSGTLGETRMVTVPIINNIFGENDETFFIRLSNTSNASVGLVKGTGTITDDGDTPVPVDVPLTLFDEFNGYFDYALTGGSFRTSVTNPCAVTTSSKNTLTTTIPATATIRKAYLFWSHSSPSADDVITFEGQPVQADTVRQANTATGRSTFGMLSDVTTIVQGIANPSTNEYNFSGLSIDTSDTYCATTLVYGGWSLMIFYTEPTLPAVSINLYDGFDGEQNTPTPINYTLTGFYAIASVGSKTTILSWEGDQSLADSEQLSFTNGSGTTTTLTGDGDNTTGANPFNSTLFDNTTGGIPINLTTLGMDLDTYDISSLINATESTASTNVQVGADFAILNAVLLKVPSNLIVGNVFEDLNYGGGPGRDLASASGAPVVGATVELYDNLGAFLDSTTTDDTGEYSFGSMPNGDFSIRVVNSTVRSTRGGGTACATCFPVQTFRRDFDTTTDTFNDIISEIGGANPLGEDDAAGALTADAQTVSSVSIFSQGVVGLDFGYNFNTIVNTNEDGQGSLEQFIINSNALDETGLDIDANGIFDPAAGEDTSIFMIPTDTDPLGRTVDPRYNVTDGYFDILTSSNLSAISGSNSANSKIDGRTQTAYSGDTNTGTIGSGGTTVGTAAVALPTYDLPEIQVQRGTGNGYVFDIQSNNVTLRNMAMFANNNNADGVRVTSGTGNVVQSNVIGTNALGILEGNTRHGILVDGGNSSITENYIAQVNVNAVSIVNGTSTSITSNHITTNGGDACNSNIAIQGSTGVTIENNLIENASAFGIDDTVGDIAITGNSITTSGQDTTGCTDNEGIQLGASNSQVTNNIINVNGGAGIILTGGTTSGNLISQNSIFGNGTTTPALGIDINDDGVTINDITDADTGPNGSLNFPIFESVVISGNNLIVTGWVGAGATVEFFLTDINGIDAVVGDNQIDGPSGAISQDYGEGKVYLGSAIEGSGDDNDGTISTYPTDVDGNTDNTNRFSFNIPLSVSIIPGSILSATATLGGSTSEFGTAYTAGAATVITNRKITYRVKPN